MCDAAATRSAARHRRLALSQQGVRAGGSAADLTGGGVRYAQLSPELAVRRRRGQQLNRAPANDEPYATDPEELPSSCRVSS